MHISVYAHKKYDQRNTCTCTIPFEMCNILRIAPGLALMSKQIGYSIPFIVTSKWGSPLPEIQWLEVHILCMRKLFQNTN